MVKQKDAVFAAINAAEAQGLTGATAREFAVEQVKMGLISGEIEHKKGRLDEKGATSYAKQLLGNWTKKDIRISGSKYVPATKRGPLVKDETLRKLADSLKSLKVNQPDNAELIARVQAAYDARKAVVDAEKQKSKVQSLDETMAELAALGLVDSAS